jgi:hypothetical protein
VAAPGRRRSSISSTAILSTTSMIYGANWPPTNGHDEHDCGQLSRVNRSWQSSDTAAYRQPLLESCLSAFGPNPVIDRWCSQCPVLAHNAFAQGSGQGRLPAKSFRYLPAGLAVHGSITMSPAASNALPSRDATVKPCVAAMAAMYPSGVGKPLPAARALTARSA